MIVCLLSNMRYMIRAHICMLCNDKDYNIVNCSYVYSKYNAQAIDWMTAALASVPLRGILLFVM